MKIFKGILINLMIGTGNYVPTWVFVILAIEETYASSCEANQLRAFLLT